MFDIQATIRWVTDVMKNADATAVTYQETEPPWMQTFLQLPLPLYVVGAIVAVVLGGLTSGLGLSAALFALVFALAWTFVLAFVFDFFAGTFEGTKNFDAAFAMIGLASVPYALGNALNALPFLGWLLSLAGGIYSIVLTYKFIPVFLKVPDAKRAMHFIVSLLVLIVLALILGTVFGGIIGGSAVMQGLSSGFEQRDEYGEDSESSIDWDDSDVDKDGSDSDDGGSNIPFFGGLERQADFVDDAENDRFTPPSNNRLTDDQVERYVDTLTKTKRLRERLGKTLEGMDNKEDASITDVFGGLGDAMRLATAEMEVVKSGGGNWAEHQWVQSQIETARVQQDLNDDIAHNYGLFQAYQEQIEALD